MKTQQELADEAVKQETLGVLLKAMLWTGGDAPNREAELKVGQYDEINHFYAYYEPGFCGCEDCSPLVGDGTTAAEAVADYRERWEAKYGSAN